MRKIIAFLILLSAIIGTIALFNPQTRYYSLAFKRFSSYEELKSFVKASSPIPYNWGPHDGLTPVITADRDMLRREYGLEKSTVPDYSTTNIQVKGVDEADVVKTDGEYIYVVSGMNVTILKAYPAKKAEVLSQIRLNSTIEGIFINEDRLVVFERKGFSYYETLKTFVKVYDVSDRERPVLKRPVSVNGSYFNSRMIGDYVYVVITQPAYYVENEVLLPIIECSDQVKEIRASEIYYSDIPDHSYGFTTILAVNVQNDEEEPTYKTLLLGGTSNTYVSLNNIYITFAEGENTLIYRFHIEGSEIECVANGGVPGYVLNQFSMDEYGGHFRIATTIGQSWNTERPSRNNLYVLNMGLNIIGKLEDLALTETIYSARFMGDKCFLVTFRQVDPFFVIDLQNPYQPKVLGKLKIPGYSSYLHPYDDDHIIGIGIDEGKVKISLFDISNVTDPQEKAKYETEGWSSSPALQDHKAVLFDRSRNLFVIPITAYGYTYHVSQGAYVFRISAEEPGDEIMLRGVITHIENDSEDIYYYTYQYFVRRALYIDNVLYTISDKKIKMNNLEDLDEINEVELP